MRILGIETSTKAGSLALVKDGDVIAESVIDTELSHSARLIPVLDTLLVEVGWTVADLECIGAGLGPGSFTGIRVGLAVAQGLAFAGSIPLVGIGSFPAMVMGSSIETGLLVPVLAAGHGRFYGARYRRDGSHIEEVIGPRLLGPDELKEFCRDRTVITSDPRILAEYLPDETCLKGENAYPRAGWIAILAEEKLKRSTVDEITIAEPIYLTDYWSK